MQTKLYEITENIRAILAVEEWDESAVEQFEKLELALEKKAECIVHFCADLEGFVAAAKAEEQRISGRRKTAENRIASLKSYVKQCMEQADRTEITAGTHSLKIQQNPPRVVVDDEQVIPARFFVIIPESKQLDKKALSGELKTGEISGAHLERGTSLRIR